jgi:hypothetical protein
MDASTSAEGQISLRPEVPLVNTTLILHASLSPDDSTDQQVKSIAYAPPEVGNILRLQSF